MGKGKCFFRHMKENVAKNAHPVVFRQISCRNVIPALMSWSVAMPLCCLNALFNGNRFYCLQPVVFPHHDG